MNIWGKLVSRRNQRASAFALAALLTSAYSSVSSAQQAAYETKVTVVQPPSPEWTKDLVIYEIATKAFTSPNGPESGTFVSLQARLPYLQNLGINAIWLTGHSLSDPKHFLNIWSQYACIEPDKIDPSLGTPQQFKALIEEAHRRGIKIFLDVITHGVMKDSPLIKRHPEWFLGEGWGGMREYDWSGGHTDLDDWWVRIWTDYVTRYGVDGYRLDLGTTRPDLWERIRQNAFKAGHPIVIFEETQTAIPGVTDFGQVNNWISDGKDNNEILLDDVPGFYRIKFGKDDHFRVKILYADGKKAEGRTGEKGALEVRVDGLAADKTSRARNFGPDGIPDLELTVNGVADGDIKQITVSNEMAKEGNGPFVHGQFTWNAEMRHSPIDETFWTRGPVAAWGHAPTIHIEVPTLTHGNDIMLSCHDNGQVGFPAGENPYSARGSRAMFGYSFLFTPMIPLFMSGEEFDADFHALPGLSPDFYGGRNPGKGTWLYGSMLNWDELEKPAHRSMYEDVNHMLALRKQEAALLTPLLRGDIEPQLVAVPYTSDIDVPVPYMRWNNGAAVIVVANRNSEQDAHLKLNVPLDRLGGKPNAKYKLTDLWNGGASQLYSAEELASFPYTVHRDKTPKGGIGLLKIELIH